MLNNCRNIKLFKFVTALSIPLLSFTLATVCNAKDGDLTCSFYNEDRTVELSRLTGNFKGDDKTNTLLAMIDLTTSKSELETRKILAKYCGTLIDAVKNLPVEIEKCRLAPYSNVHLWSTWDGVMHELFVFGTLSYQPAETRTVSEGCNPQYLGGPCQVSSGRRQKISEETCSVISSPRKLTKPARKIKS
jgi:hypothetical protein